MPSTAQPDLEPGRAYRTHELRRWGQNPTRLAARLVRQGRLREAAHGLYYAPLATRLGPAPASESQLLRAFLNDTPFLITGPPRWNALDLGATAMFASTLVYNTERTGEFKLDGRRFLLRRVRFPTSPSPEWFIVDLFQHYAMAGVALTTLEAGLTRTLRAGRWEESRLRAAAQEFGTHDTRARVERCVRAASTAP